MKIDGDQEGIEVLKAMHARDKSYLKHLIGEARTNTDQKAHFSSDDGTKYVLSLNPATGGLLVERA